jgi:hypothetical protein
LFGGGLSYDRVVPATSLHAWMCFRAADAC